MTLTTQVRIDWPVAAVALLDHVTTVADGDPATVARRSHAPGDPSWGDETHTCHGVSNVAGQGLRTLASVRWGENQDVGYDDWPQPPALVVLTIDNPYGFATETGRNVQATKILPAVRDWLDGFGVPRDRWWWEDETAGTFHPGTTDVSALDDPTVERETWTGQ